MRNYAKIEKDFQGNKKKENIKRGRRKWRAGKKKR